MARAPRPGAVPRRRIYADFLLGADHTVAVLADVLRSHGADRAHTAESWAHVAVEGTRGQLQFSRTPGISVWQWKWPPIQVVDRDPAQPDRIRILHAR